MEFSGDIRGIFGSCEVCDMGLSNVGVGLGGLVVSFRLFVGEIGQPSGM